MPLSFLIQRSWDQRPFAGFPRLIAGYRVFRRLSMPRHPPCTLSSLTAVTDHRHTLRQGLPKGHTHEPAGNGSGLSKIADSPARPPFRGARSRYPLAKKVLDDSPAKTEKTLSPPPAGPAAGNQMPGRRSIHFTKPPPPGDNRPQRLPKPSVEPLFTCQRTT